MVKIVLTTFFFSFFSPQFLGIRHGTRFPAAWKITCRCQNSPLQHGNSPGWNNSPICKAFCLYDSQPRKGGFRELKSQKFPGGSCPRSHLQAFALDGSFRKSVSIGSWFIRSSCYKLCALNTASSRSCRLGHVKKLRYTLINTFIQDSQARLHCSSFLSNTLCVTQRLDAVKAMRTGGRRRKDSLNENWRPV